MCMKVFMYSVKCALGGCMGECAQPTDIESLQIGILDRDADAFGPAGHIVTLIVHSNFAHIAHCPSLLAHMNRLVCVYAILLKIAYHCWTCNFFALTINYEWEMASYTRIYILVSRTYICVCVCVQHHKFNYMHTKACANTLALPFCWLHSFVDPEWRVARWYIRCVWPNWNFIIARFFFLLYVYCFAFGEKHVSESKWVNMCACANRTFLYRFDQPIFNATIRVFSAPAVDCHLVCQTVLLQFIVPNDLVL